VEYNDLAKKWNEQQQKLNEAAASASTNAPAAK